MTNNLLKFIAIPSMLVALLAFSSPALASEITGTLSTTLGNAIQGIVIAPPVATPAAGTYTSAQSVTLTAPGSLSIYFTTNGTAPSCGTGTIYSGAIGVGSSMTIQAISCYAGDHSSTAASYGYTINIPAPSSGGGGGGGGGGNGPPINLGGGGSGGIRSNGDTNFDGKVDISDFVTLMANWGKTGSGITGDFNGDGKVDILDFVILMANWTK